MNAAGDHTYMGYTGGATPGVVTLTLPLAVTSFGANGSKPGAVIVVKDEVGLVLQGGDYIEVVGNSGQLIDGNASEFVHGKGSLFLIAIGTGWQKFVG